MLIARHVVFGCFLTASIVLASQSAGAAVVASFDWSMQDRFGAIDRNGMIHYATDPDEISPASWSVDFDACESTGSIRTFRWSVNGQVVASTSRCGGVSLGFPEEGTYRVTLDVVSRRRDGLGLPRRRRPGLADRRHR